MNTTSRQRCPKCNSRLDGGPTWFTCVEGHGVPAADLRRELNYVTDATVDRNRRAVAR
jgi:hypothetical protein